MCAMPATARTRNSIHPVGPNELFLKESELAQLRKGGLVLSLESKVDESSSDE